METKSLLKRISVALSSKSAAVCVYGEKPIAKRGLFTLLTTTVAAGLLAHAMSEPEINTHSAWKQSVSGTISRPEPESEPDLDNMDKHDLSRHLLSAGRPFAALAISIENIQNKAYTDSDGGTTIGIGYNIKQQIASRGLDAVIGDMQNAGINERNIALLLSPERSKWQRVTISTEQAIVLLDRLKPIYRRAASKWIGNNTFESLTPNQQSALIYLAYNVGETNLRKFHQLKRGVRSSDPSLIEAHIAPAFKHHGRLMKNNRAGKILLAAWRSESHIDERKTSPARIRAKF